MMYDCNICQLLVYVEDEFVEHIKRTHLSDTEDEILLMSEIISLYSDMKKARRQEETIRRDVELAANVEFYCFYGDSGEKLIFTK